MVIVIDGGGFKQVGGARTYVTQHNTDDKSAPKVYGRNVDTDTHVLTSFEHPAGHTVTVDHSLKRGKVDIMSNMRGQSKTGLTVTDAKAHLKTSFGIDHSFKY